PDAYVSKVRVSGSTSSVVFATYLGGDTADQATALAVDAAGNIYITGTTGGDFPVTPKAAIRSSPSGGIFAAKLSSDGSHILYATYLPGSTSASPAIAVDPQGNAYVTGQTTSQHAFVAKLNADGTAIVYYIALAGAGQESGTAIAADAKGNVYVTGLTSSANFPVS